MKGPKWWVIARNEYRMATSGIRSWRKVLPILIIAALAIFVFWIAPGIASLIKDETLALLVSQAALASVEVIMVTAFFYFLVIPISNTLRESQTEDLEALLSSPLKPADLLLGKFLGKLPLYGIGIVVVAGIFTAVLSLRGISILQTLIIVLVFLMLLVSAMWLGEVVSAVLRTRLRKTSKGKDIGKALAMLIALPMLALFYAIMGGWMGEALSNPGNSGLVETILMVFPTSWGAGLVLDFGSHPGILAPSGLMSLLQFTGVVLFFVGSFFLGTRAANRVYSLEPTGVAASWARKEGLFYRLIRRLGRGSSFSVLLVTIFKDYARRLENLSRVAYVVGLMVLIAVFLVTPEDPLGLVSTLLFTSVFLAAILIGEVTIRGKESLFIYRRVPKGESRYLKARLIQSWIIAVPLMGVLTSILLLLSGNDMVSVLLYTGFMVQITAAYCCMLLGLFLMRPAFSDKSSDFAINIMIAMGISVGILVTTMILFGASGIALVFTPVVWALGIGLLLIGKSRLEIIE